jgi:hypothetical protein
MKKLEDFTLSLGCGDRIKVEGNCITFKAHLGQMGVLRKGKDNFWSRGKTHDVNSMAVKISNKTGFDVDEVRHYLLRVRF